MVSVKSRRVKRQFNLAVLYLVVLLVGSRVCLRMIISMSDVGHRHCDVQINKDVRQGPWLHIPCKIYYY